MSKHTQVSIPYPCPKCNGKGDIPEKLQRMVDCPKCQGKAWLHYGMPYSKYALPQISDHLLHIQGYEKCSQCRGLGKVEELYESGSRSRCFECGGKGTITYFSKPPSSLTDAKVLARRYAEEEHYEKRHSHSFIDYMFQDVFKSATDSSWGCIGPLYGFLLICLFLAPVWCIVLLFYPGLYQNPDEYKVQLISAAFITGISLLLWIRHWHVWRHNQY